MRGRIVDVYVSPAERLRDMSLRSSRPRASGASFLMYHHDNDFPSIGATGLQPGWTASPVVFEIY